MNRTISYVSRILFLAATYFYFGVQHGAAQISVGPRSATSFINDDTVGVYDFNNVNNAAASDNNRASASALLTLLTGNTHYLRATGFGFSIPAAAQIKGITVEVEKSATGISIVAWVEDNSVRLIKDSFPAGSNYAKGNHWTGTEAYHTYGGATDLWGTAWTPAQINSPNFGVVFSASITGVLSLLPSARIDHIRVTVHYDHIVVPVKLIDFTGKPTDDRRAQLQWTVAGNEEEATFTVQRSTDGSTWTNIGDLEAERSATSKTYQFTDDRPPVEHAYYRLQIGYPTGRVEYSSVIDINFPGKPISIYPNPALDYVYIESGGNNKTIDCIGVDGRTWVLPAERISNVLVKADISRLPRGMYILAIGNRKKMVLKN